VQVAEAAELGRIAAAACTPEGRPLYAGHGSLPCCAPRAWSEEAWDAEVASQQAKGWLDDDGMLVGEGTSLRERVEAATDRATSRPTRTSVPRVRPACASSARSSAAR
jgi:hypothetical protein